jgi:hypothetical protein
MPVLFRFLRVGFLVADRPAAGNRELTVKDYACPFPAFAWHLRV